MTKVPLGKSTPDSVGIRFNETTADACQNRYNNNNDNSKSTISNIFKKILKISKD